ncbi:Sua5/YciO/YrdC/YwlC family tRNA threonylcarbamoyl adenosine modification protein [Fonsecaea erecta]|uniref:Threonylcarbamoyl-AMP synthase n=1 Tax=Fonsecaea erecta TaxID=1367422 RepID=A0A178Z502_9EURO|nr:Sua5/YciO/YrdC/YwlC family tRNA threonylcarbamoyl adenosine modification protein [Fonsecaea erecta]OAP54829.1 Sua5/YciO/YrdC/YwlC family tRNA threonylcarbamoyl adenosine modification protein [Fonsecaea erecta]
MRSIISSRSHLASMPYTHCRTRIIDLRDLDIPEHASDEEYRAIYLKYVHRPSHSRIENATLLRDAVESIKHGIAPPVAFPTETVYGLGADATNEPAVSGIFAAKGRPSDNPLIVHVSSIKHLEQLTGEPLPAIYVPAAERFWPGPLTILLPVPSSGIFARNVHPFQSTIGFRIPSSKYARFFIAATGRPIAGPSANSSGKPSPTTARHVLDDLNGKVNFILDGGDCEVGVESTVVDGLHDPPLILRPGGVGLEELRSLGGEKWARTAIGYKRHSGGPTDGPGKDGSSATTTLSTPSSIDESAIGVSTSSGNASVAHFDGNVTYEDDVNGAPRAPGMKYRHYSPQGRLVLFSEDAVLKGRVLDKLNELVGNCHQRSGMGGQEKPHEVKGGIISCYWPSFAGLPVEGIRSTISAPNTNGNTASEPFVPDAVSNSAYVPITSMATTTVKNNNVTLYNVQLGPDISTLAHSLFGVLRLFDELGCTFIFAETVRRTTASSFSSSSPPSTAPSEPRSQPSALTNGAETTGKRDPSHTRRDLEDAVVDRIEKAAAERVD